MKLLRSMLKPRGCVESRGLWNLLGFIDTKPLIRVGGLGQGIPALTAKKQLRNNLTEELKFPGSRFRMLLGENLHIPDRGDILLGPNAISQHMRPETRLFFSRTLKLTCTYEWT